MPVKVNIRDIPVLNGKTLAKGIEASWAPAQQWVAIVCNNGTVACGAFDVKLMDAHHQTIATAHDLITCEDLLEAKISEVTSLARAFGVKTGITGREAVELLLK
ncbi:MAG: DUF1805 domain-containing protein [Promethearchaeota archaeon]